MIVTSIYCDAGLIDRNPSPYGGTYCWRHVGPLGTGLIYGSGYLFPADVGAEVVGNNLAEFYAVWQALRSLPDGWSGKLYTDSRVAISWVWEPEGPVERLPDGWMTGCCAELARLGAIEPVRLKGHPSRKALAFGVASCGTRVSSHNKFCDTTCARLAREYKQQHGIGKPQE
jgi:uncharacterized protein YbdZ (MbtH family)